MSGRACRCCGGAPAIEFAVPSWRSPGWPTSCFVECADCRSLTMVDDVVPQPSAPSVVDDSLTRCDDPVAWLSDVRRRLAGPGGRVVVVVPVAQGPVWEEFRDNWVSLDPPTQRWIPTVSGLEHVAAAAGLRVQRLDGRCDASQFVCSELIARRIPPTVDPAAVFSPRELQRYRKRARALRSARRSPHVVAVLVPEGDA